MAMIVTEINVGFIGPDDLRPVFLFIAMIEVHPAHPYMLMGLVKKGTFLATHQWYLAW